jgi:DUF4097 and DUF4098 domain-containing protein YvlB
MRQLPKTSPLHSRALTVLTFAVLLLAGAIGAQASVNKSIRVDDGETIHRDLSSVNGSIRAGDQADIRGEVSTVNGRIALGDDCQTRELSTVNGSITIGRRGNVDGDMEAVNGSLRADAGTTIRGNVTTVNGSIDLRGATVGRDVETVNGSISLDEGTIVEGNVIIEDAGRRSWSWGKQKPLEIEISGGSVVKGKVENLDDEREVIVILRDGSAVEGELLGVTVERR